MNKQMAVKDFYWKHVPVNHRIKWLELMEEWDQSTDVYTAFYDITVMQDRLKEAREF